MDAAIGNGRLVSPRKFPEEAAPEVTIREKNEREDKSPQGNHQVSELTIGKPNGGDELKQKPGGQQENDEWGQVCDEQQHNQPQDTKR
jgi:hypothetical protein